MTRKIQFGITIACFIVLVSVGTARADSSLLYDNQEGEEPGYEAVAIDVLLVRPLGLAGTIIGGGLFAVSLPFSVGGGMDNIQFAGRTLVAEPAAFTFARPWGEFYLRESHHGKELKDANSKE